MLMGENGVFLRRLFLAGACLMMSLVAPVSKAAGTKSEELFTDWVVRTLETPDGQLSAGLTTASKDPIDGIAISCKVGQPLSMSVSGRRANSQMNSLKDMAGAIKVKVSVDRQTISSEWKGMLIPVGYFILNDKADDIVEKMKGKVIKFQVNDIESSYSLKGFAEGLARFKEVCVQIQHR